LVRRCLPKRSLRFSVSHRGPLFWQREPFRKFQEQPRSLRD
jgi:hypothetical protein